MAAPATSRARILAIAREEFASRGFTAARLQDIAERAGLTHPTLLYHFGSKERLYSAVIEDAVDDWAASTRLRR
jgi:TetR/AcrR family transcriptional regulator